MEQMLASAECDDRNVQPALYQALRAMYGTLDSLEKSVESMRGLKALRTDATEA